MQRFSALLEGSLVQRELAAARVTEGLFLSIRETDNPSVKNSVFATSPYTGEALCMK